VYTALAPFRKSICESRTPHATAFHLQDIFPQGKYQLFPPAAQAFGGNKALFPGPYLLHTAPVRRDLCKETERKYNVL
jgi:hypothetical protein